MILRGEMGEVSGDALTRAFGGSKEWIERNNPTVEEIEQDIDRREPLLYDLYNLKLRS